MMLWESFDKNEVSLLLFNLLAYLIIFLLPKKFTPRATLLSLFWGVTIGMLFDFTIGGGLLDFYRVSDSNRYEVFDLVYFLLYAPFGYLFFYFYEGLNINKKTVVIYILGWALIGVFFQWIFVKMEIITFQKGYKLSYSFPVFLVTQTISGIYYEKLRKNEKILR
ncbi:hypothetical protein KDJ21_017665 [Metabacillus litoralis]|uniref:hypothetical protein n=1 Tax=Metabacillus TaxID=2675233 RepID=UPI000EF57A6F|nr:hypothetical protein [Metabacillus litoralis]MCM3163524.1 hypothetical protein [Metabacillus litoralis]UHA58649.1 hypothetical protein KDJ21_017665 [Metabacillus litoralis]